LLSRRALPGSERDHWIDRATNAAQVALAGRAGSQDINLSTLLGPERGVNRAQVGTLSQVTTAYRTASLTTVTATGIQSLIHHQSGVFENYEFSYLFGGYRSRKACLQSVEEMPGTLAALEETDDLIALLALGLYFCWDICLLNEKGSVAFFASHDDWFSLTAFSEELEPSVKEFLDAWQPSEDRP
jgi:hypothetical protein